MRGDEMKKGSALLIVLGMVAFMVVSAVGFAVFMRHNRIPSSFLRRSTAARELARAALACAMSDIESAIEDNRYPGLGNSEGGPNRWIGCGRVFAPYKDVSEDLTVSTLTLEGLAYLPPPMINDVRYYSRRTSTAQWKRLDYDSGRYAFCAVNVSDFFDLSRVSADRPRGSGDQNLITTTYLFEDGAHKNWGEVKPIDDFQNKINEIIIEEKTLVSLADYNLALKSHRCKLTSPFVEYIEQRGANGFYNDVRTDDKTNPDYLKYAIQRFVVDGHSELSREEWFEKRADNGGAANTGNPFDLEDLDISKSENQPFPDLLMGDDETKNDYSAGRICEKSTKFLQARLEQFNQCEWMSLYDYLDRDDVPLTVAAPTVDRSPMVVAVAIDPNSNLKVKIEEKDSDVSDSTQDGIKTYYKTVTFFPVFEGSLVLRVGLAYPFKYRKELYEGLEYKVQAIAKFYPLESTAAWEAGVKEHGCRTSTESIFGKWDKGKPSGSGVFKDGIITLASSETETNLPEKFNGTAQDAVSGNGGNFHDAELKLGGFGNLKMDTEGFIARYHLKRRVKIGNNGQETAIDQGIEVGGQTGWTFNEAKAKEFQTGQLRALPDAPYLSATAVPFGSAEATYVWGMALAVKVYDDAGNLVDMAPAHVNDDDKSPEGDFASHLGALGRPVLRFDDKTPGAPFTVGKKDDINGYTKLHEAHESDMQAVTLSPAAYFTDDPRYNYAAENWFPENNLGGGESLGTLWLGKQTSGKAPNANLKDRDIFMSVSNQGYLQDPGEIAFLPRVCGFDTQDEYNPVKNAATGVIPNGPGDVANKDQMWRTYGCFGKLGDDEVDNLRLVSPVKGFRVNPFTDDEMVKLAPFLNTPYDWWAAGTNLSDSVKQKMIDRAGKTSTPEIALRYSFGERGDETKVEFQYMNELANNVSSALRGGGSDWYNTWREDLSWIGGSETSICGVDLGRPLHSVDRKYLYSYWRKCYANAQQLFIVFFRAEPVVLGGGSVDGNTPAQLGARGVAVVWRDPIDAKGAAADAPHRMRVLFYRQFD